MFCAYMCVSVSQVFMYVSVSQVFMYVSVSQGFMYVLCLYAQYHEKRKCAV